MRAGLLVCARGATEGVHWIAGREVKCEDPGWTDGGEGCVPRRV